MKRSQPSERELVAVLQGEDLREVAAQLAALRQLSAGSDDDGELPAGLDFAAIRDQLPADTGSPESKVARLSWRRRLVARPSLWLLAAASVAVAVVGLLFALQRPEEPSGLKGLDCCGEVRLRVMRNDERGPLPLPQRRVKRLTPLAFSVASERRGWLQLMVVDVRQRTVSTLFAGPHQAGRRIVVGRQPSDSWQPSQLGRQLVLALLSPGPLHVTQTQVLTMLHGIGHGQPAIVTGQRCSYDLVSLDVIQ